MYDRESLERGYVPLTVTGYGSLWSVSYAPALRAWVHTCTSTVYIQLYASSFTAPRAAARAHVAMSMQIFEYVRASGVDETAAVPRLYGSYFSNSGDIGLKF